MKITILGMGSYALALAYMFNENNCQITMYSPFNEEIEKVKIKHPLSQKKIPSKINLTNNLKLAIQDSKIIVYALPSKAIIDITKQVAKDYNNQLILVASKGIDNKTYKLPCQQIKTIIKTNKIAFISGGGFAIDIIKKQPFGLTVASSYRNIKHILNNNLKNDYLTLHYTTDIIGVQICACLKNVIAISMGILDGRNYSDSTKSYFITNIISQSITLLNRLSKNPNTIISYCGLGDMILSSYSKKSRNYYLGYLYGSKKSKKTINNYINNNTIEGLNNLETFFRFISEKNIKTSYIINTYNIIFNDYNVDTLLQ